MTVHLVRVHAESYADSVRLMSARRSMRDTDGTGFVAAVMGTRANREDLVGEGFDPSDLDGVGANDLVLAVEAASEEAARAALDAAEATLRGGGQDSGTPATAGGQRHPRTLEQAVAMLGGANVALISVPADYAVLEAHKALSAGLHVLLFSSGISVDDEIELKDRGRQLGRLVMGPDAGTAMLGRVGLGFANVVDHGPVGVVAAAGTGAQEVMTLLHRWGAGSSHVIGVGGRDTSAAVDGAMTRMALRALRNDDATEALLLVSKPPSVEVASALLGEFDGMPAVTAFVGLEPDTLSAPRGVHLAATLEQAALATLAALGRDQPDPGAGMAVLADHALGDLNDERKAVRGLFSGGTLCYEAMVLTSRQLGAVHSNTPIDRDWGLPAPDGAHIFLDLGAEEFTQGRPHPMIDPEPRVDALREHGDDPATAVVLLDVVLGYGAHPDPAGVLAPACAEITARRDPPAVVAYVLGTADDPQDLTAQRKQLADAGCLLAPTNARAALLATAIASRRPDVAEERA
jgi:FdrA protein